MAQELGYGQPMGGIAQTAFVVEDLGAAIDHWVTNCRAGPFFVLDHFLVPGQTYRGEESRADITIAMGFAGHMLIELIQPLDDERRLRDPAHRLAVAELLCHELSSRRTGSPIGATKSISPC